MQAIIESGRRRRVGQANADLKWGEDPLEANDPGARERASLLAKLQASMAGAAPSVRMAASQAITVQ